MQLWGECSPDILSPSPKSRKNSPPASPFTCETNTLQSVGMKIGVVSISDIPFPKSKVIWLPSIDNLPFPSSRLISDIPDKSMEPRLSPWKVNALALDPMRAVELLCACVGKTTLETGLFMGEDIAYLTQMLRFAGALVAGEHFLPDMKFEENTAKACWTPVLAGEELRHWKSIVSAAPASIRAMGVASDPPTASNEKVMLELLQMMVDHLVRTAAGEVSKTTLPNLLKSGDILAMPLHDKWLLALHASDGVIKDKEESLKDFAGHMEEWKRSITFSVSAPFRLCFRLEEPVLNGAEWCLSYLLQPVDDLSLLIPLSEIWDKKNVVSKRLTRDGILPMQYALMALGQASALSPHVRGSLKNAKPDMTVLNTAEAHSFLTYEAPALEQAGYGVFLPAWWSKYGTKVRVGIKAMVSSSSSPPAGISLGDALEFRWQLSLGDSDITDKELRELAKLKEPLVRVRGQWVELRSEEIREALNYLKRKSDKMTGSDLIRMALGRGDTPSGMELKGVDAKGWFGDLLERLKESSKLEELTQPAGFNGELRPYQRRGYTWLSFLRQWGLGACLADDMGLGKTVQTLAVVQRDRENGVRRPVLLICPTSVVENWRKESERFTPDIPILIHYGPGRSRGESFVKKARKSGLVFSSYSLLHRDKTDLEKVQWAGIILDEAQNIKNPDTRQASAARSIKADYRIALTGTPVENHVGELWSIMEFLNSGLLGSRSDFHTRFFLPIQSGNDQIKVEALKRLTEPFILRRLKSDKSIIADLPEKQEMKVYCSLTKEQASLYMAVAEEAKEAVNESDGIQRKGMVLAALTKLKQICNHPAHFLGDHSSIPNRSRKLDRLKEMLEEMLEVGEYALIFTQYMEMGDILQRYLQESFGMEVPFLHGGVSREQRERMVERFQAEDGNKIFILSLKAGGTGLNLTRASHVFHFDRWWNPAVENQATDRAYRIGQKRNVQVHKFLCAGTIEEKVDVMIERKREIAAQVVSEGEGWLTELSTDALKELCTLNAEAIGD